MVQEHDEHREMYDETDDETLTEAGVAAAFLPLHGFLGVVTQSASVARRELCSRPWSSKIMKRLDVATGGTWGVTPRAAGANEWNPPAVGPDMLRMAPGAAVGPAIGH